MEPAYNFERRFLDRFKIHGARVIFYTANGSYNFVPLTDISKGSIRFENAGNLKIGDALDFELSIPAKEKIILKGKVVLIIDGEQQNPGSVVIQFAPFGTDKRYNSSHSHQQLNDLIEECLKVWQES